MLSISNFGSSRNCKSFPMHAYLKSCAMPPVPNQNPAACNPMQPYGMLKVWSTHCYMVKLNMFV